MAKTWDFEGYWNTVLGANRSAADVVREFQLDASDVRGLDEWLGTAEADALAAGGKTVVPEEWTSHHARALALLADGSGLMSDDIRCDKVDKMRAVSRARAQLRAEYDRAEYLLVAAIATHKAATCWVDYSDPLPPDDYLETIEATKRKIDAAVSEVERAKAAAEGGGVIVQTHSALIHL